MIPPQFLGELLGRPSSGPVPRLSRVLLQARLANRKAALAERRKASVRAKAEHVFLYQKRQFDYAKVRYRGLAKNTQRIYLLVRFANLMIADRSGVTA